jgi:P-type Ca2+ transporter type 2C
LIRYACPERSRGDAKIPNIVHLRIADWRLPLKRLSIDNCAFGFFSGICNQQSGIGWRHEEFIGNRLAIQSFDGVSSGQIWYISDIIPKTNMAKVSKIEKPFYQLSAEESVVRLGADAKEGLTQREAERRLAQHGENKLTEGRRRPLFFRFLDQFRDFLIIVLIVAALLSYYLKDFQGGTVLMSIVIINAIIGFYQEYKAERILEGLKQVIRARATVIRDGLKREIPQEQLVPGDLIYMEEGGAIPADVRLTEAVNFSTNDFILTGESMPQPKRAELIFDKELTLTDQDNLVFLGVSVATGNATGVVFATGMQTAIGQIARTSESIERDLSPLQIEMNNVAVMLTKIAGVIALGIFGINLLLSLRSSQTLPGAIQLSFLLAISVAAACVPQGLPAQISVALSLGVGRMARRNAVVRKLSAVETLGATTVIGSDKTGTITKNEMTITNGYMDGRIFEVKGEGYDPKGSILEGGKKVSQKELEALKCFLMNGFLASKGRVNPPDHSHPHWYAIGDPTEAAFTPLAIKAGLDPDQLEKNYPLIAELPFDSDRKRMVIVRRHKGNLIGYMKGGLESVLAVCTHIHQKGQAVPLAEIEKKKLMKKGDEFAGQALRVIALAYRDFPKDTKHFSLKESEKDFVFAGFVTMLDPPRFGVKEAFSDAYDAHLRVLMITGDNALTAQSIAKRIGMRSGGGEVPVFTGDQMRQLSDAKLKRSLKSQSIIFSRVSPHDKFRIVSLLKGMGEVVAVTGDGVNDTLSLKKADIGVAMGKVGSEVAKEASEIVLLDDNFRTIVFAIREGRTIFHNLKKNILANIVANNGELTCVLLGFVGMAFGLPAPITAVQILSVDMLAEIMPLAALTFDPGEEGLMKEAPRNLNEHVLNWKSLQGLVFYGFWIGAAAFFSFVMVHSIEGASVASGRAAAYLGIVFGQFMNILSSRTEKSFFNRYLFTNPQLWISFLVSLSLISVIIYVKSVSAWFGFEAVPLALLKYPAMGALLILVLHEGRKLLKKFVIRNS